MGCFIPSIPGIVDAGANTCFPVPQSIVTRATASVSYAAKTMSASASFIATASPAAGTAFVNYGCYQDTAVTDFFDSSYADSGLPAATVNVDTCVNYCNSKQFQFAALYAGNKCACGNALNANTPTPNGAMESCNQPCAGSLEQNCGGSNGPVVYARSDVSPNLWASSYTATWSSTLTYSCAGSSKYSILTNAHAFNPYLDPLRPL
ncbi:hypothetical protein F5Y19DRAFT_159486 [Xylariaceae sp. FL1651]|nr:hypothetical protein F5Y19DRAFT_159486 [Xylariaceae sp. FL1651]